MSVLLEAALALVKGDVGNLEPEIAIWFFGDREMSFYAGPVAELTQIRDALQSLAVAHAAVEEEGRLRVLAISPAVNTENLLTLWKLESVED